MTTLLGKRYEILDTLGKGAMGVVYRAIDRLTGQVVALKQVKIDAEAQMQDSSYSTHTATVALAREFQTLSSLRHPHIISVLDYGFDNQQPFFTMTLLENPQDVMAVAQEHDEKGKVHLLIQMLQAIAYLHRRDVIHRDLKPSNVLVSDGHIKVLDFGLAFQQEAPAGTLAYMAPETLRHNQNSPASDLYSIGVMAYEMFAGRHPFELGDTQRLMRQIFYTMPDFSRLEQPPQDIATPDTPTGNNWDEATLILPEGSQPILDDLSDPFTDTLIADQAASSTLAGIVEKLLRKDPADRYQDAYKVIADLAHWIGEAAPTESRAIRESYLQAANFVGRDAEMQRLAVALDSVLVGTGSSWLVGGESGVGKTRLLNELRTVGLVRGVNVLWGRANAPESGGLPYETFRDSLRRLVISTPISDEEAGVLKHIVPDIDQLIGRPVMLAPELPGREQQSRLLLTIVDVFRRQTQPTLLILEDLHWVKESLPIVGKLADITRDMALMIAASFRIDEAPHLHHELPMMSPVLLERLGRREIAALSQSMLGTVGMLPEVLELIERESEGNAFFMVEIVRALSEEAGGLKDIGHMALPNSIFPQGIHQIVQRRMERIPIDDQPMLRLAAVAGRQLDFNILRQIDPVMNYDRWLEHCANAGILAYHEDKWRFTHDKLRDGILDGLAPTERPRLNRMVARAIEEAYPDDDNYIPMLANHWTAAGEEAKADYYATLAGRQAMRISQYQLAARYFEQAVGGAQAPLISRIRLSETYFNLGEWEQATRLAQQALDDAIAQDATEEKIEALYTLSRVDNAQGDYGKSYAYLIEALQLTRKHGNNALMARVLWALSENQWLQHHITDARIYIDDALPLARQSGDLAIEFELVNTLGATYMNEGDYDTAGRYWEQAYDLAKRLGDKLRMATAIANQASVRMAHRDYPEAMKLIHQTLDVFHTAGRSDHFVIGQINLAECYLYQKDPRQALIHILQGVEVAAALNAQPLISSLLVVYAHYLAINGNPQSALRIVGCVQQHCQLPADTARMLNKHLSEMDVSAAEIEAGLAIGRATAYEVVAKELLPASDDTMFLP